MNETPRTDFAERKRQVEAIRTIGSAPEPPAQPALVGWVADKVQSPVTGGHSMKPMTLERWEQTSRLFYATLEVNEKTRAGFLEEACFGDTDLLCEVKSLLSMEEPAEEPLGQPSMDDAAQDSKDNSGSLVGSQLGPYQVESLLGVGGMGEVYKALDTRLERVVALKVLSKGMTVEAEGLKRFQQEARTIAALNHPHICTLYDIGEHNGRSFLVMEYLTGETLAERLKRGPFPFEQVLDIGTEIAEALEAAHKQGVVHRDVKPGNVILTAAGAKLIDFGLAKLKKKMVPEASTAETASETTPGLVMGTVEYMSPEQLDGLTVDARTDLWGLGVILFEMLTGRRAFEGTSRARVIAAILEHKPAPLTTRELPIPKLLEHMVKRCLAKKPECRWASARDLADQLRALRRDGRAVSLSGALASRLAKLKWAVIGALLFVALALNVGTGL